MTKTDANQPAVVVVGAGPAGMAAAVRAQESGARVTLIDDNDTAGGQIWRRGANSVWFDNLGAARVQRIAGAQVIHGDPRSKTLLVEHAYSAMEVPFDKLILATGAREIFLPFPGWTLPGIFGVGGLQALAKAGWPVRGKRIVVAGTGPLLLAVAAYLSKQGARVTRIVEQAKQTAVMGFALGLLRRGEKLTQAMRLKLALAGIAQQYGSWVEAAEGNGKLERLHIRHGRKVRTEQCDYAAIAYGLCPNVELASFFGCKIEGQAVAVDQMQQSSVADIYCAGECTGIGGVELSLVEGEIAGYAAAGATGRAQALFKQRREANGFAKALEKTYALRAELRGLPKPQTIVCRCEDVTFEQMRNYSSFRAAKLHTRCGMGPCQGRVCGSAAHFLLGWDTTSFRPPILAARIGALLQESKNTE